MTKSYIIMLMTFLFITQKTIAQIHGGISAEVGVPINEFHDKLKDVSGGARFSIYFPIKKHSPFFIGTGLGFGVFGSKTQYEHKQLDVYMDTILIDIIPIDFKLTTKNNFFNGYFSFRYKYPGKVFQPYAEARVGFNNFYTRTTVYDETEGRIFTYDQSDNKISTTTQVNSFTYSVGGEGGVIFKIGCWGINVGVAYLLGGEAKYYSKNQISQWTVSYSGNQSDWNSSDINPSTVELNSSAVPLKSRTDMLLCTAGFTFHLCDKPRAKKPKATSHSSTTNQPSANPQNSQPKPNPPKPPKGKKPNVPMPNINPNGNPPPPPPKQPGK